MLEPGSKIELTYPTQTLVESLEHLRRRRIHVVRVRDLVADPLTPAEFLRRPLTQRSRWLITGFDDASQEYRQFYLGSSLEYRSPGVLKIALYEPGGHRPAYAISRPFGPSKRDRIRMAQIVASLSQRHIEELELRIYADDLQIFNPGKAR